MLVAMADFYLWLKALHVIAVISWMAGLFYLPRLFVYHADSESGGALSAQFKIMEYRLARYIMLPAALAAWAFGIATALSSNNLWMMPTWLIAKLIAVVALTGFHVLLVMHLREFSADRRVHGSRYFRMINEVPTVLLIVIVILVVVKPF